MKQPQSKSPSKGGVELVEEAFHALRHSSLPVLACYFAGTLPFVFGVLYFLNDMLFSAQATSECSSLAFLLALLFVWMKFWQVEFARGLKARLYSRKPAARSLPQLLRTLVIQSAVQPTAFFVVPLAFLAVLPFGWAAAFYQSLTALGDEDEPTVRGAATKAGKLASLWPRQNIVALLALSALALFVFLNLFAALMFLPALGKTFLGIESIFTKDPRSILNSTFFMVAVAGTYLCMDPVLKAFYVLRCFYGESLASGEDLKVELRCLVSPAKGAAPLVLLAMLLAAPGSTPWCAAGTQEPVFPPRPAVSYKLPAKELDRALNEVLNKREFRWRLPRQKAQEQKDGLFQQFFKGVGAVMSWGRDTAGKILDTLGKWLRKLWPENEHSSKSQSASNVDWEKGVQLLVYVLLALTLCTLALVLYRMLGRRRQAPVSATPIQPATPVPDITDESVSASALPEDEWIALAHQLLEKGEFRLALRALYLAGLAHLERCGTLRIARFKSNRDYWRELHRRAHDCPQLLSAFRGNLEVFERTWYGTHQAGMDQLHEFERNLEVIQAHGSVQ